MFLSALNVIVRIQLNTVARGLDDIMFIFNYALQPFKAYFAILVRRSNFRNQASPRITTRQHPAGEGGTVG